MAIIATMNQNLILVATAAPDQPTGSLNITGTGVSFGFCGPTYQGNRRPAAGAKRCPLASALTAGLGVKVH
jgi:hypothetical protein